MDKNAIKKYAVWARRELISRVSQKALQYGITDENIVFADADSVNGHLLTVAEKTQRKALIAQVNAKGYEQVREEVAYTWFNRFSALRFMEVNGYLPSHVRVFTDDENNFKPQILVEAIHLELDGLDMNKVYAFKEANQMDKLYRYLLITQCNALNAILPGMFQKIEDYTELLFPDNLLREGSAIEQMIALIPEDDWKDAVEIIGWLYQYYINEPKDKLINAKKQYKADDVPFVTQIFTSDWIVRYMVQNSLGRSWVESTGNDYTKYDWEYYLTSDSAQKGKTINPEDIRVIDPCMGSGHIIVYVFDVLMQIYEDYGYSQRDAAELILQKNLYGLDISERAYQLAYFSVMMKARKYNRSILKKGITPNLFALEDVKAFDEELIRFVSNGDNKIYQMLQSICTQFEKLGEYGSLAVVEQMDFKHLFERLSEIKNSYYDNLISRGYQMSCNSEITPIVKIAEILSMRYDSVITNPPYIGNRLLPGNMRKYIEKNYGDFKSDLFSAFVARIEMFCKPNGSIGMLTPYVWMYISSYEKLRKLILSKTQVTSLVQLEYNAFESACVPVCTFTLKKTKNEKKGVYVRLSEFKGSENQAPKTKEAANNKACDYRFEAYQSCFEKINGAPIAYWMTSSVQNVYTDGTALGEIAAPRKGNSTSDNARFLRLWFEVSAEKLNIGNTEIDIDDSKKRRWYPYNKGGGYRKWYGFNEYVIDWYDDAAEIRKIKTAVIANYQYFMKPGLTWSTISSLNFSIRWFDEGYIFDNGGCCIFDLQEKREYIMALLNSRVFEYIFGQLNPTLNFQSGEVAKFPVIYKPNDTICKMALRNVELSREDWNSSETSWDFVKHPLVKKGLISEAYNEWSLACNNRFLELKTNEEKLNKIFIEIYGLTEELNWDVDKEYVTVGKIDYKSAITGLISYAVGCMFGRYSLDETGLVFAGGEWDDSRYSTYSADKDNIIHICDDDYFEDDIVGRFVDFIGVVYGQEYLEENISFIAAALPYTGTAHQILRQYFMNDFYNDHCNLYTSRGAGKRPIYWLFDSGKKNGFKALIYMHRYQPDTIARLRTDYVHEQQARYRTAIADLEQRVNGESTSERVKLNKQLIKLQEQAAEIQGYEEKIHHLADQMIPIDLDDGVKHNYEIFEDVLAKIK